MTTTRLLGTAAFAAALCGSFAAFAESKEVIACYGVCNRTVPNQAKRNQCFAECRAKGGSAAGQGAGAAGGGAAAKARDAEQEELNRNRSKESSCHQQCSARFRSAITERRRCEDQCIAISQGRASGIRDRWHAEKSVAAEEAKQKAAGNVKGKPGPIAERAKALAAYNRAIAILKTASRIRAGQAGYIGETHFREKQLREVQKSCESQFTRAKGELFVYDPVNMMANQIIREYNESVKAPRYGAETYR